MKTLIVSPYSPYPLIFGGAIRVYHLLKMFVEFSDVTLLTYASWDDGTGRERLNELCERFITVPRPSIEGAAKGRLQARATFSPRSYQFYSHYSKPFQQALHDLLRKEQFAQIVVEHSQMGYFAIDHPRALRILDLHNIEYELLERRAQVETKLLKKAALALEAAKFRREEIDIFKRFDMLFTASERERDMLRAMLPQLRVESLPNSIDAENFALRPSNPSTNELVFVGTTQVDANRDAICYFMEKIFPLIERRVPDVRFTIVGGSPPPMIRKFGELHNVEVTGFVKDVREYMARARASVVPLRSGGGTRLKILEGLSIGLPTVSTSLGAEGIATNHNEHILLADTPQDFADNVVRLLNDSALQDRLRLNGRRLVESHYSWQAVGRSLQAYLNPSFTASTDHALVNSLH